MTPRTVFIRRHFSWSDPREIGVPQEPFDDLPGRETEQKSFKQHRNRCLLSSSDNLPMGNCETVSRRILNKQLEKCDVHSFALTPKQARRSRKLADGETVVICSHISKLFGLTNLKSMPGVTN